MSQITAKKEIAFHVTSKHATNKNSRDKISDGTNVVFLLQNKAMIYFISVRVSILSSDKAYLCVQPLF